MSRFDARLADDSGKAVFTLGPITPPDKRYNQIIINFCVSGVRLTTVWHFCCDILTESKDTIP